MQEIQSERVLTLSALLEKDSTADVVTGMWSRLRTQIQPKLDECKELRDYVFATDTTTTSVADKVGDDPANWKNNVHLPKLCEIRDNLLAIYKTTWFPNDNWLKWEAFTLDDKVQEKRAAVEGYMRNKVRASDFEGVVGDTLAADYVDYGMVFGESVWRDDRVQDENGVPTKDGYVGPVAARISPEDIVFDLTATSFKDSPKIIRRARTVGDMMLWKQKLKASDPVTADKIEQALKVREEGQKFTADDFNKASSYSVDGFGNYHEYLSSGVVEILDFRGTLFDPETNELKQDHQILVMDRRVVIKSGPWDSWLRDGGVHAVGYRERPDNLWCMGPLDNLVGLQYRIDHLQGAKDDNVDLHIHPIEVVTGDPDVIGDGPGQRWQLGEGDNIEFKSPDLSHLTLDQEIQYLLQLMEEFAGSPKQSRGFRTPGEKTLGEVSLLESNSNRLFLDKAIKFEKQLIEKLLNSSLALARENLEGAEAVQTFDSETGLFDMLSVTAKELSGDGVIVPIGARHFGQRNQQLTNLMNLSNTQLWPLIAPHFSGKQAAELIKDNLQLSRFGLVRENAQLYEQAEAARVQNQVTRELQMEEEADTESDLDELGER